MSDNRTAYVGVARFRHSIAPRGAELEAVCKEDLAKYRNCVSWWIEAEAGIAGSERTGVIV